MGPGTCSVEGVVAGFSRADMKGGGLQTRPIFCAAQTVSSGRDVARRCVA